MARNSRRISRAAKASHAGYGSSNYYQTQPRDPFGPAMAAEIFSFDEYDYDYDEPKESYGQYENETESVEDLTYQYWYQTDLPLENVRELEDRFRRELRKFERAYRKMIVHALKWHYLMEDLEDNPQLDKMFKDIQLMRKLGGSEGV